MREKLNSLRQQAVAPAPEVTQQPKAARLIPNKYAGKCKECQGWVPDGAGHISKVEGRWLVFHNGECPEYDREVESRDAETRPVRPTVPAPENPVRHGIYTVDGAEGHATFRISHQADDANFAPGQDIIGVMLGSDNTFYTTVGFLNNGRVILFKKHRGSDAWWQPYLTELVADPDAALESLKCRRCNRDLTTPESLALGIGPECAKHE